MIPAESFLVTPCNLRLRGKFADRCDDQEAIPVCVFTDPHKTALFFGLRQRVEPGDFLLWDKKICINFSLSPDTCLCTIGMAPASLLLKGAILFSFNLKKF